MTKPSRGKLAEVSPPFAIQNLKQTLEARQPQVKILSPRANQVLNDTQVEVRLQVNDLPLFKDEALELGPYLQVVLDKQPYAEIYDTSEPLKLENLTPGTHTLRVFAVRPWHESFKNEGAFAQTTFHIFTQTPENNPNANQPLLTYNAPQGVYGAEPFLLDFYLTNAPLHLVAREDAQDAISDWQIRCTINGESFTFDRWEPIYLKGLKPGKNWVQLELLDENGNPLANAFNNTVQVVTYEPGGTDTLAQLTRGELTADAARKIVDPNYVPPPPPPTPEPEAAEPKVSEPEVILEPNLTQEPAPETMPPEVVAPAEEAPEPKAEKRADEIIEPSKQSAEPALEEPTPEEPTPEAVPKAAPERVALPKAVLPEKRFVPRETEVKDLPATSDSSKPDQVAPVPVSPKRPEVKEPEAREPKTIEERIKEKLDSSQQSFQPAETPQPVTLPPQLEMPKPAAVVEPLPEPIRPTPAANPALEETNAPPPEVAPAASAVPISEFTSESPKIPSMMGMLDRIKDFFEGLRQPSTEAINPLLAPLLEDEESLPSEDIPIRESETDRFDQSEALPEPTKTVP